MSKDRFKQEVYYKENSNQFRIRTARIEKAGKPFAHNALSNDATNEQLNKQAEFYTNTINNIQQERQNKTQQIIGANTNKAGQVVTSAGSSKQQVTATQESTTKEATQSNQKASSQEDTSSNGSNQARLYVCDGATLKCSQGDKKSTFKVIDIHNVYIEGKPMATIEDSKPMVNIKPFGKCKSMANPTVAQATAANNGNLKPMPCQPNIIGPWQGGKEDVTIASLPTVLETSTLQCTYAGVIEIVDPGQDLVRE